MLSLKRWLDFCIFLAAGMLLTACGSGLNQPTLAAPTLAEHQMAATTIPFTPTLSPTGELTLSQIAPSTLVLDAIENYSALSPGQYIVYSTQNDVLDIVSPNGYSQRRLTSSGTGFPISADGRLFQLEGEEAEVLNLLTGQLTMYPVSGSISSNGEWVAEYNLCDENTGGVQLTNIQSRIQFCIPVSDLSILGNLQAHDSNPIWSPDGRWIAIVQMTIPQGMYGYPEDGWVPFSTDGLYLIDTSCILDPETCPEKMKSIYYGNRVVYYAYMRWSPDGNYVVVCDTDRFIVYSVQTGQAWYIDRATDPHNPDPVEFAISEDSLWIAYSSDRTNILLQPLNASNTVQVISGLTNVRVLGWLTSPLLKVGKSFTLLPAGDNLGVRIAPGLDSESTSYLYTGDSFTVLDGPIQLDGYTWWYIRSDGDGAEGWVREFYNWFEQK